MTLKNKLLSDEFLEGNNKYKCANCNRLTDAVKTSTIKTAPPILILNLNRFNKYGLKMKNQFEFPLTYDLTSNIFKPKKSKLIYELTALIIHEGRFSFRGHYFSYVKGFNNKWYKCDDEHIAPIEDNEEILTSCPYILFYRMKAISRKSYLNFAS